MLFCSFLARILCEFPQKLVACITAVAGLPGVVDIHAVALVPAVAGVPAVASILAAASAPDNPGVPIDVLSLHSVLCNVTSGLSN